MGHGPFAAELERGLHASIRGSMGVRMILAGSQGECEPFSFAVSSGTFRQPCPGPSMHHFRWLLLPVLAVVLLAAASVARANPQVQLTWQLLDYIAVDYAGAVEDGKVISDFEYAEMREFSATVGERLAQLPEHEARAGLMEQASALQAAVEAKAAPAEVE